MMSDDDAAANANRVAGRGLVHQPLACPCRRVPAACSSTMGSSTVERAASDGEALSCSRLLRHADCELVACSNRGPGPVSFVGPEDSSDRARGMEAQVQLRKDNTAGAVRAGQQLAKERNRLEPLKSRCCNSNTPRG